MNMKSNLLIAAVALLLASCGNKGNMKMGDNEYPVVTIGSQNAELQTTYPATIKGVQDVQIRPKVSGFITKVCVQEGQAVKAGQLLFVIDNTTYQAAVRQAQASVNSAKSQLNTAKLTYENSQKLFKSNVIGSYELQSSQNSYETAMAAVAQAKAALASAQETLGFCYVKSPANGVVGSLPYKVGALVSAGSVDALTTVSDVATVEVYFSVTEKDILDLTKTAGSTHAAISAYPPVKLLLSDGTTYKHPGKVTKVSGVIDASTGSVSMIARFPNPERLLKSGGSGTIVVPRDNSNAIVIPQTVTTEVQNKIFVYTVGKDNKVKYTEITVDPQNDGNHYVVTGGLHVGDRIVTKGITSLTDGMEIKPITEAQYEKKIADAVKMSASQGSAKGFIDAMSK
ncbi:efflux RND transporter periplasmic adaptor subunit [Prevotella buccae]|jgi:membrane fusion protein (multidrug efflux system)|uniref:efflux RND transporter periplasmic adaptor subunit n=1 Tax=Segatella buccae TaxID=28126 RepID=UPI001C5F33A4|nr:efflux RND transporter periplasmic adaptor subunit [Segatella buccae]MBW4871161.1 efflux RND transporter periplasmic adaptor subunit [Segatella buccae]